MSLHHHLTAGTAWQRVEVWRSDACCEFRVAGAVHAWWHRERLLTGLAWDNLAAGALLRPEGPPRSLLMLGLAGGTALRVLRHLLPDCRFTAVDIDPDLVELAREFMALDEVVRDIRIADAYEWITSCRERYDVVVDDCYLAGEADVFRPEKRPERRFGDLRRLVTPGGLLLTNLVTGSGHRTLQSRTRAAYKRAFPRVRSVTTPESMNETLVGGDEVLSGGALDPWRRSFGHRRDRDLWNRLAVRRLK